LFGEKYGEKVRVVKFGDSVEFCGGTHTDNTGHIGSLRIVAEGAVAAGMRRIEAVTGAAAERYVDSLQDQLESAKQLLKNPKDLSSAIQKLQEENATLRSQIEAFQKAKVADICKSFGAELAKSPVLSKKLDFDIMQLKDGVLQLAKNNDDMALVLGSVVDGKPQLMICLGQNRVAAGKNAGTIIRTAGKEIQGGGGGQPAYATAGGKNAQGIDNAIAVALKEIGE
jgi:alanyl-tRNA synthetase